MKATNKEAEIRQAALEYAGYGWKIVLLHPKAKRPRGEGWQHSATSDEEKLAEMFDELPDANIGLLLGPPETASGIIDVEFDSDEGRETAEKLLPECYTPTYKSARSVHRLFRWSPLLPNIQKDTVKGVEIRIGNDNKATQSVLPPSKHPTGADYQWLPGLSPGEVEVAEVPESILTLLANYTAADEKIDGPRPKARDILDEVIEDGFRNDKLYRWAFERTGRMRVVDDPQEQADLFTIVDAINQTRCRNPLPKSEVRTIVGSAIEGRRKERKKADALQTGGYTEHGLLFQDGEWFPGDWRLVIVLSDPVTYRLCVPAWKKYTHDQRGEVTIPAKEFSNPDTVAQAILITTRKILLNATPGLWASIWSGTRATKNKPATIGLHAKLLADHDIENPPPSAKRHAVVAEYLLEKIIDAPLAEKPDSYGSAVKIQDGTDQLPAGIWFRWRRIWQEGILSGAVDKAECNSLQNRIGLTRQDFTYFPHRGEPRLRYCVLKDHHIATLRGLVDDDDQLDASLASVRSRRP